MEDYSYGALADRRALVLAAIDLENARPERERFVEAGCSDSALLAVQPVFGLACRAEVAAELGIGARATTLYAAYLPWAGQIVVGGVAQAPRGAVDRYLGMLATEIGRYEEAEKHHCCCPLVAAARTVTALVPPSPSDSRRRKDAWEAPTRRILAGGTTRRSTTAEQ